VSPFVLSVLKYGLLVLLYFFIYRAIKTVTQDLRGERRPARRTSEPRPARSGRPAKSGRGRVPTAVAVREVNGKKAGTYQLTGPLQIGRAESCAIRLEDTYVSQVHAKLYGKNGAWFVEDLGSTNGTYLNDGRVTSPVEIHAGDRIRVGRTVLELRR
jgi:FHA domain-containing protein